MTNRIKAAVYLLTLVAGSMTLATGDKDSLPIALFCVAVPCGLILRAAGAAEAK